MKKLLVILIGCATIGATFPASAGPDWQVIEHGRKVKLARMKQELAARAQAQKAPRSVSAHAEDQEVRK
jgi:hypothetical protein